jgi:hypothetical protein
MLCRGGPSGLVPNNSLARVFQANEEHLHVKGDSSKQPNCGSAALLSCCYHICTQELRLCLHDSEK